jgi:hypothetical protein
VLRRRKWEEKTVETDQIFGRVALGEGWCAPLMAREKNYGLYIKGYCGFCNDIATAISTDYTSFSHIFSQYKSL